MRSKRIGILGGAFDPIHDGHLMMAKHCLDAYSLDAVRFVPTAKPLLKEACVAKPWQRAAMVGLAIADHPKFYLDLRELLRDTPSYAVLTLQSLQAEFPGHQLCWILGADAFADLPQWYRFEELATLCDLIVVSRAQEAEQTKNRQLIESCFAQTNHTIWYASMPLMHIASRAIRSDLTNFQNQIPNCVWRFIVENEIYDYLSRKGRC